MRTHVKILGVMHIGFGVILAGFSLLLLLSFALRSFGIAGTTAQEDSGALIDIPVVGGPEALILAVIGVLALPEIAAGYGLLNYRLWARTLGIVVSALNLLSLPIGTVISVYGLWVLLNKETKLMFLHPSTKPASAPLP